MDLPHKEGAAGGAAEVTSRINVIYFMSRGGRTDRPHLFRVNHHSRAGGVRLRDVKRWLSEIRGKDMPENFWWSYRRKYKAGYVWQDLKDDGLITPVSDNEYVLKGCDVRSTPPRAGCVQAPKTNSLDEKERDDRDEKTRLRGQADRAVEVELAPADSDEDLPRPAAAAGQDSPSGSGESPARRSTVLFKIEVPQDLRRQGRNQQRQEPLVAVARVPQEQLLRRAGSKARGMRVARALHSILTCGAADADDAAIRPVARLERAAGDDGTTMPIPTCPGMDGCGLRVSRKPRLRTGGKEQQARRDGRKRNGGDAHKPVALPRCSQCGKEFKPQELHSHMQSCRAFKERMRSSTSTRLSVDRSRNFSVESRSKPARPAGASVPSFRRVPPHGRS